ncbi:hypothetical protein ONR75_24075 [Rhodopseudomonas sp. P2A-2r]|uniref:hypothetical protein n=1 Tax=Rhodopseudomonas sp. P2A-2r TaxID=2991972 RepID=UPI00223400C2|nr:hypothetical protein [Rhodopseudomonas sp. P2A-2r]UZE47917.1 hypothetical protein ONR75_24075 [Rhodopseudomonas sp. P2A-2r]
MNDKQLKKLREELAALDPEALKKRATDLRIDISSATSREDIETLIERDAVAKAEEAAAAKPARQPVKSGGNAATGRRALGDDLTDDQIAAIQKVWAWYSRNTPFEAQSSGVWEIDKSGRKDAKDHGVLDGDYRVLGADWILAFRGGRFVSATRARPDTRADSYANVPVQDVKL